MNTRLVFSIITPILCLALLIGAFLIVPNATQAQAPKVPISVSQPSACTILDPTNSNSLNYQTCVVTVSISSAVPKGVHFSVSYSSTFCYYTCSTSHDLSGVAIALPEGSTITQSYYPVHVLLIVPYYEPHGMDTMTFTFAGPANKVSVQLVAQNSCC
ncbi:MAG: hypothetical protein PVSMB2_36980 [Ktedonobacteraceae bacterium]